MNLLFPRDQERKKPPGLFKRSLEMFTTNTRKIKGWWSTTQKMSIKIDATQLLRYKITGVRPYFFCDSIIYSTTKPALKKAKGSLAAKSIPQVSCRRGDTLYGLNTACKLVCITPVSRVPERTSCGSYFVTYTESYGVCRKDAVRTCMS